MLNIKRFIIFMPVWLCGVPLMYQLCYTMDDVTGGLTCMIFPIAMILSQVLVAVVPKFAKRPRRVLYIALAVLYVAMLFFLNLYCLEPFIFIISYIVFLPMCVVLYILNVFEVYLVVSVGEGGHNE